MNFTLLPLLAAFVLVAADVALAKPADKQDICHFDADTGLFHVITISQSAVSQHLTRHGDALTATFYPDADGDGYGAATGPTSACANPGFVGNNSDAFPNDPSEHADSDGDGVGDNADAFPNDPTESKESDGDGVGDNADAFPNDPTESKDSDGDGVGDNADAFPNDPTESKDSDGDGVGDNADSCPTEAGSGGNGCPAPAIGSDLVIGKAGEFGHKGNIAMMFGDGSGGYTMDKIELNEYEQNHEVAVGDVNKDGKDDVVVVYSKGQVHLALGGFSDGLQNADLTYVGSFTEGVNNCCNRTRVLQLADVNNDGNLDIAVTMWSKLGVMLGNGDGTFGSQIQSPATGYDARGMALGDLDGDGFADLVANHAPGSWWLAFHHGNGNGTFQPGVVIPNSALAIPNLFIRDADGDGDLDIYTGALGGRMKIFTNGGSANFTMTDIEPGAGFQGGLLVVDDLNGDGTPDAVAGTEANNFTNVRTWLSNGSGGFTAANYGPVGSQPRHGVVADINKDGIKDLAMVTVNIYGGNPGSLWTLRGNGDGTFQAPTQPIATYRNNYTIAVGNFR